MVESTPGLIGGPMFTSVFRILTASVVAGIALSPGAASAAMLRPAALAYSSSSTPSGGDPDTTVTFTVTVGLLSMTAPASANLATGTGAPGTTISGALGNMVVTDDRALLTAAWTVDAAETDWALVGGGGTTAEIIPAGDATYNPGDITTTGVITAAAASTPPSRWPMGRCRLWPAPPGSVTTPPRGIRLSRWRFPRARSAAITRGRSPNPCPSPAIAASGGPARLEAGRGRSGFLARPRALCGGTGTIHTSNRGERAPLDQRHHVHAGRRALEPGGQRRGLDPASGRAAAAGVRRPARRRTRLGGERSACPALHHRLPSDRNGHPPQDPDHESGSAAGPLHRLSRCRLHRERAVHRVRRGNQERADRLDQRAAPGGHPRSGGVRHGHDHDQGAGRRDPG